MLRGVKNLKKLTCNLKTIAFTEFCLNMLFSYFWLSHNIVKLQTCSSLHGRVIATLTKVLITHLLLVLEVCNMKPTCRKSWARNFLMWSNLTLGPSFKVKC